MSFVPLDACNGFGSDQQPVGRPGPIPTLHTPFDAVDIPDVKSEEISVPSQRPCTRARSSTRMPARFTVDGGSDAGAVLSGSDGYDSDRQDDVTGEQGAVRKKVGRPISFQGDINSKDLTDAERRRIKRREANRESARRVRQKRQETMEELQARMDRMQQQTAALTAHLHEVESHRAQLLVQLKTVQENWSAITDENARLRQASGRSFSPACADSDTCQTLPSPRSNQVDMTVPSMALPQLQHGCDALASGGWPPQPISVAGGGGSAVTSGGGQLRILSCDSVATIFRAGVTVTSATGFSNGGATAMDRGVTPVVYSGGASQQYQSSAPFQQLQDSDPLDWFLCQPSADPLAIF